MKSTLVPGTIVVATQKYDGIEKVVKGTFEEYTLSNPLDPESVVGVVKVGLNAFAEVDINTIRPITEEEQLIDDIIGVIENTTLFSDDRKRKMLEYIGADKNDDLEFIPIENTLEYKAGYAAGKKEVTPSPDTDIRVWKFIVDAVLTSWNGIGNYLDNPDCEKVARKLKAEYSDRLWKPIVLNDHTITGLDMALEIIKSAKNVLPGCQTDDGIYECDRGIEAIKGIMDHKAILLPAGWTKRDEAIFLRAARALRASQFAGTAEYLESCVKDGPHEEYKGGPCPHYVEGFGCDFINGCFDKKEIKNKV